jgi:hypothetical protein
VSIDWFVLLTPIVLVIVALPLLFVGCTKFDTASETTTEPSPTVRQTTFRLEMDRNLQQGLGSPAVRIDVVFRLKSSTGAALPIELPQPHRQIISTQIPPANPPALDPLKDPGAFVTISEADLGARDRVNCVCKVTLANGNTPNVTGTNTDVTVVSGRTFEFRIQSRRPQNNGFRVFFNGA